MLSIVWIILMDEKDNGINKQKERIYIMYNVDKYNKFTLKAIMNMISSSVNQRYDKNLTFDKYDVM